MKNGFIDEEVSLKEPTDKTITFLIYSSSFGGGLIGKDMQVELLSTDNCNKYALTNNYLLQLMKTKSVFHLEEYFLQTISHFL